MDSAEKSVSALLDEMRALRRKLAETEREVAWLARVNSDQCDEIFELQQKLGERG